MQGGRNEYQVWAPASSIFRGVVEEAFTGGKLFETDERTAQASWPNRLGIWQSLSEASRGDGEVGHGGHVPIL